MQYALSTIDSLFSLRGLGDIYWDNMPPVDKWWNCLSKIRKLSDLLIYTGLERSLI